MYKSRQRHATKLRCSAKLRARVSLSLSLSLAQKERKRKNANAFVCTPSERFIIGTLFPFYPLLLLPFLPFTLSPFSWKKCLAINLISPPAARVAAAWQNPYPGRQDRQHKLTGRSCLSKFPLLRVFSTGRRETEETRGGEKRRSEERKRGDAGATTWKGFKMNRDASREGSSCRWNANVNAI